MWQTSRAAAHPNYETDCSICFDAMTMIHSIRQLPCSHRFHRQCIDVSWNLENLYFLTIMISEMDV